ncbi:MAG: hypothetical protein H7A50_03975 [Akkermansiaceae bacterium]|nr:hypothetical protein [Akkermansiaceae bacterium]
MKQAIVISCSLFFAAMPAFPREESDRKETLAEHQERSVELAEAQDELSADVQQLIIEQTAANVIELLEEVEDIMDETTERLDESDTGGETIAAQTEIIEKIHEAAKERQSQGGSSSGSAMMDMMERMMGKQSEGDKPGEEKGEKPSDKGGSGVTGDSDAANEAVDGAAGGKSEERRVPKAAGSAGAEMPEEFRKAFDAYNRGLESKLK